MSSALAAAPAADAAILARIQGGLRLVTVPFPHLSGLCANAHVTLDDRIPTMGVFASGRLVANREFTRRLKENELVFVLAHEMLHLALRTHDRARGSDRLQFNYAHDYIINDILRTEMGFQQIPAGGLDMPGAREKSVEEIVVEMRKQAGQQTKTSVWEGKPITARRRFEDGGSGGGSGNHKTPGDDGGDVLDNKVEREMFPDDPTEQQAREEATKALAAKALSLARAMGAMKGLRGMEAGGSTQVVGALRGLYRTPWHVALQRWIESVAPGERTFARPSRRGAERTDIVLPGRKREGWILNVLLDTSGSMTAEIPRALGAIADFCDAVAVDQVRLVQCDAEVTADELLNPTELAMREITGYGGSDLSPAMQYLADDPNVNALIVVTDGDIAFPRESMPYSVLWVLPANASSMFQPPYGRVVRMDPR